MIALRLCYHGLLAAQTAVPPNTNCALSGPFYLAVSEELSACLAECSADSRCGGFTFKSVSGGAGEPGGNCSGHVGQACCYLQSPANMGHSEPRQNYSCWQKPEPPGKTTFNLGANRSTTFFGHFWEQGINSPHSAITLRADYQRQMTALHDDIGYKYTRIHAPFARDYSVAQGPPLPASNGSATNSYFNAFATYDFLLSIGMKPWIELGYTPCWMSGPAAVSADSYWPTVDYGICVGSPRSMHLWTDLIHDYVGAMVSRYGLAEVENWVWVLYNEPGGINAYSESWQTGGFTYYDMFFNTSKVIKGFSAKMKVGGLSDSPAQATNLVSLQQQRPDRAEAFDLFTYHSYCNGKSPLECGSSQIDTVSKLRKILPQNMPIYLEETGSSAGCYTNFHDTTGEAAFVVPYITSMYSAGLQGAHWWCASDIYTEHGCPPDGVSGGYKWIPNENYSGGMPRAEFTGRWGFTTPSGVAKPIHRAFQLLHAAGTQRFNVTVAAEDTCGSTTQVLALANSTSNSLSDESTVGAMIFVSNNGRAQCNVTLTGFPPHKPVGFLHRIDHDHGNPLKTWQEQGSPPFPNLQQISALKVASELNAHEIKVIDTLELAVPPNGLSVLVL